MVRLADRQRQGEHHGVMTFLDQIQAEIKKVMQERQHQFVVEVLRRRTNDMTLGDLCSLLSSPLGQNLEPQSDSARCRYGRRAVSQQ